uniref:Tyrosinase_Cu-bd domain-containing protein n=1 Tax=Heligmosomoides polygyrus TaxID=6339 RepID=A0A183FU98_HELPZ
LPSGKLLQKALRKEARMLSDDERFQIAFAFNKMKESGMYDRYGFVHKYSGLHEGPGFFTWHREYLKRFELAFRRFLPEGSRLGMPYWDSSLESELPDPRESIFFSSLFVGASNSSGQIVDGPFASWKTMEGTRELVRFVPDMKNGEVLNNARIDIVLEQKRIEQVLAASLPLETCKIIINDDRLLSYSHDYVHYFINGDMKETYSSTSEVTLLLRSVFIVGDDIDWSRDHDLIILISSARSCGINRFTCFARAVAHTC